MATIREENCSLSRTSCHLAVVTASGAQSHIQWANRQRHYALHKLPLLLRAAPPSETCLKAPRRRKQLQKTPEVTFHIKVSIPKYTKEYYWNPGKILRMRERLVPGPYLSPSAPARVKTHWVSPITRNLD